MAVSFFAAAAIAEGTSPLLLSLFVTGVVFQSASFSQIIEQVALPGRPFQSDHLVRSATCCAARMASHSVGATTPTKLPFTTTCAFGKFVLSNCAGGNQLRAQRLRMHHARMQHAGQPDIGHPVFLGRDFGNDHGVLEGFADDCVLAHRLQRRIAVTVSPMMLVRSPFTGMVSFNF